jgi:hypothetical protein
MRRACLNVEGPGLMARVHLGPRSVRALSVVGVASETEPGRVEREIILASKKDNVEGTKGPGSQRQCRRLAQSFFCLRAYLRE